MSGVQPLEKRLQKNEIPISIMCSYYVENSNITNQIRMFLIVLHNLESEEKELTRNVHLYVFVTFWKLRYCPGLCDKSN